MPRQDIQMNAAYGEIETKDNLLGRMVYDLILLGPQQGEDNDVYRYAEILVPERFEHTYHETQGIHIVMGYLPEYKQLRVRLRKNSPRDNDFVLNKGSNSIWFPVFKEHLGERQNIRLSEYRTLNESGSYNLLMCNDYLALYSGAATDLCVDISLRQNELFLLRASAGNLYQHPTTGVGLIDYLHGNFENTGLAVKLQQEFGADKMIVHNAYMNSETGELLLEVTETDG